MSDNLLNDIDKVTNEFKQSLTLSKDNIHDMYYNFPVGTALYIDQNIDTIFINLSFLLSKLNLNIKYNTVLNKLVKNDIKVVKHRSNHIIKLDKSGYKYSVKKDQTNVKGHINNGMLKSFILTMLKGRRKSRVELLKILCPFNFEDLIHELDIPIENKCIQTIQLCIPQMFEEQKVFGNHRVDVYFPHLFLAVEIDENGHKSYDKNDELIKEHDLRQLGIELIRFNPDGYKNDILYRDQPELKLIYLINEKLQSPSYKAFKLVKNMLT